MATKTANGHADMPGEGPDIVAPATRGITWIADEAVTLKMGREGVPASKPVSVPTILERTVKAVPQNVALAVKRNGEWQKWTYQEYRNDVLQCARAMIKVGLEPYHGVGIIGFNSPEWFIADLGAIHAGGFATGIYTTNSPEACEYVAANCEANVIVVENDAQLQKILKVRQNLPHLKAIVQYSGELSGQYENTYTWKDFMAMGDEVPMSELEARIRAQAVNKCCTLIYTSGTTGNPKGVMLSHDNITHVTKCVMDEAKLRFGQEVVVSYLPLSHIAAQLLDIYAPILTGGALYFAQPDALKGTLANTLKEVRPTMFLGVPRVWEKMEERMKELGKETRGFKKTIATWAKGLGLKGNYSLMNGGTLPMGWTFANAIVFKKIKQALGFDRCRYFLTGAAPIMKESLEYFMSLDLPIMELYGMSENTGPHSFSVPWSFRIGSVGKEIPGVTTKLDNPDKEGNGEICMNGRHVFMGYLNMEEKTMETFDDEGWLHTGDIGKKDQDGFLYITGRIKELIITAGGENVPPVLIEDMVKVELPIIGNCMLIGDKKKFLSMLLTLKTEADPDTMMPLDKLTPAAVDWCKERGSSAKTVQDILEKGDEAVLKGIQEGIDRANAKSTSRAQKIQKWSILPRDFSIPGGELGPTMKLKRPVVVNMYDSTINAFYD